MAGERLVSRFSLRRLLRFRWTGKCFETATSHMQNVVHNYRMEKPKEMKSRIRETETEICIETPVRKSWVLIIVLGLFAFQLSMGLILTIANVSKIPVGALIFQLIIFGTILFFLVRFLAWQLKGVQVLKQDNKELVFQRKSPIRNVLKSYNIENLGEFRIKDNSVSEGPIAMLQLLGISDKIQLTVNNGYDTVKLISGIDIVEAEELKAKLEKNKTVHNNT